MAKLTLKCARCGEIFYSMGSMAVHDKACKIEYAARQDVLFGMINEIPARSDEKPLEITQNERVTL